MIPRSAAGPGIRLLFGRTRSDRRRALAHAGLGTIDALGRPGFIYLTGSRHKRDTVLREFVGRGTFSPDVQVFEDFVADAWHRFGDGRALLEPGVGALLAWRLLDANEARFPTLASIPDRAEVGAALSALEQALDGGWPEEPELRGAVGALRETVDATGAVGRAQAMAAFARLVDKGGCDTMLRAHPVALVDDLTDLSISEANAVVALCRAWDRVGVDVVLATPCGRNRGGSEVGALLGIDEPELREFRLFKATQTLRAAAFELVATGEAEVFTAHAGRLDAFEPWAEAVADAPRDLGDAYADGFVVPVKDAAEAISFAGPVQVFTATDPYDEVTQAAAILTKALAEDVDPRDCAVAAADMGRYGPVIDAVFADFGLPFRRLAPLAGFPVAQAMGAVLGQALDGFTPEGLCGLAAFTGYAADVDVRTLQRQCAAAGIRAGAPTSWDFTGWALRSRVPLEGLVASSAALRPLADALVPLSADASPDAWFAAVVGAAEAVGIPARAAAMANGARVWGRVVDVLDDLVRKLTLTHRGGWAAADLRRAADRALAGATIDLGRAGVAEIPVLPFLALDGLSPRVACVLGLYRGATPPPPTHPFLTPPAKVSGMDRARYVLGGLLREASGGSTVLLTWPATVDGVEQSPAPVLSELLELPVADNQRLGALLVVRRPADGVVRRSDGVRAAARRLTAGLDTDASPEVTRQVALALARRGDVGIYDGQVGVDPTLPDRLSVTAFESYMTCPARYWYEHVLQTSPLQRSTAELEPRRRGIAIHRILDRFAKAREARFGKGQSLQGADDNVNRTLLHETASAVLDAIEAEGGFDPLFHGYTRSRWLAGLVDDKPRGILAAWLAEESAGPVTVPEATEARMGELSVGPLRLTGVLDRVDRLNNGARLVLDYKTGLPPSRAKQEAGLSLQLLVYASLVAARTESPVAAAFVSLARPDVVRWAGLCGDGVALDALSGHPAQRRARLVDADDRQAALDRAGVVAARLVAGDFAPTTHRAALAGCDRCAFRRACRVDDARHRGRFE